MVDLKKEGGKSKAVLRYKNSVKIIDCENILYIEKDLRKIHIHIKVPSKSGNIFLTKDATISFYGKMKDVTRYLPKNFLWCHRSYIINMNLITELKTDSIVIERRIEIPLGRDLMKRTKDIYLDYINSL